MGLKEEVRMDCGVSHCGLEMFVGLLLLVKAVVAANFMIGIPRTS